jgi:hypothetical protein
VEPTQHHVLRPSSACRARSHEGKDRGHHEGQGPGRRERAIFQAYGEVDAERELRARALGVRRSGLLAVNAAAVDSPALLAEALAGLRRAVDRPLCAERSSRRAAVESASHPVAPVVTDPDRCRGGRRRSSVVHAIAAWAAPMTTRIRSSPST